MIERVHHLIVRFLRTIEVTVGLVLLTMVFYEWRLLTDLKAQLADQDSHIATWVKDLKEQNPKLRMPERVPEPAPDHK